jgi:hypothetical protein
MHLYEWERHERTTGDPDVVVKCCGREVTFHPPATLMLRAPSVSGTRPSLATTNLGGPGSHISSANNPRVIAKKKEYYTVTALERNADTLRETFLAFAKQMKQAEEGAECGIPLSFLSFI